MNARTVERHEQRHDERAGRSLAIETELARHLVNQAATGFAISPLSETVRAVQLLAKRETPAVNARRLGVTPSAVSQHLAVLHRGGLVDKRRSGRAVLYQTTALGLALLGAGSALSGASAS
jgi:DNA-binding transcriptional ArsR family regulator